MDAAKGKAEQLAVVTEFQKELGRVLSSEDWNEMNKVLAIKFQSFLDAGILEYDIDLQDAKIVSSLLARQQVLGLLDRTEEEGMIVKRFVDQLNTSGFLDTKKDIYPEPVIDDIEVDEHTLHKAIENDVLFELTDSLKKGPVVKAQFLTDYESYLSCEDFRVYRNVFESLEARGIVIVNANGYCSLLGNHRARNYKEGSDRTLNEIIKYDIIHALETCSGDEPVTELDLMGYYENVVPKDEMKFYHQALHDLISSGEVVLSDDGSLVVYGSLFT